MTSQWSKDYYLHLSEKETEAQNLHKLPKFTELEHTLCPSGGWIWHSRGKKSGEVNSSSNNNSNCLSAFFLTDSMLCLSSSSKWSMYIDLLNPSNSPEI